MEGLQDKIVIKPDKEYAGCMKFFLMIIPIVVIVLLLFNIYDGSASYRWGAPIAFCIGYLLLKRQWYLNGKEYIFDRNGVEVVWKGKLCRYAWNELEHKQIVHKVQRNGRFNNADRCLVLSPEHVKDSLRNTPFEVENKNDKLRAFSGVKGGGAVLGIIPLFRSSNIIMIYFDNKSKDRDKDGAYYGTVDYEMFMKKLVEWGIQLDTEGY